MALLRLLYKPLGMIAGLVAGRVGRALFRALWSHVDDAPPPAPGSGEGTAGKMLAGQVLQASVMTAVAVGVERASARLFHHLVGVWPTKPSAPPDSPPPSASGGPPQR